MKKLYLFLFCVILGTQLIAQPTRNWVSYYSGKLTRVYNICYDSVNNCVYIAGSTGDSVGIATPGSFKDHFHSTYNNWDVFFDKALFLAKFDLQGNRIWGTYVDTSHTYNDGENIVLKTDHSGNIVIATYADTNQGSTNAATPYGRGGILYKINPQGNLLWASYLIGFNSTEDSFDLHLINFGQKLGMDIDAENNIYVCTATSMDTLIGTLGTYQPSPNIPDTVNEPGYPIDTLNLDDALLKFDSNGVKQWGTYFGGTNNEWPGGVWCSNDGAVYVTGFTKSHNGFGTTGVYQSQGPNDTLTVNVSTKSFLCKFTNQGQLDWSTFIYGPDSLNWYFTWSNSLCGDNNGNVYVFGGTNCTDSIATANAFQPNLSGDSLPDLFLMKFNNLGQRVWGTYFGGTGYEPFAQIGFYRVNLGIHYAPSNHSLFIAGYTDQINNLVNPCSFQTLGTTRGFIAKIDSSGTLGWASHFDVGINDIAIKDNPNGNPTDLFICGFTNINGMATPGAFKETKSTPLSGYIGRFGDYYDCSKDTLHLQWLSPWFVADSGFSNYQWYHNSVVMPNEDSNALYIADTTGMYFVSAERCGCTYYSNRITFTDTTTQVSNFNPHEATLSVFPNPAHNTLSLQLGGNSNYAQGTLQISNAIGKALRSQVVRFDNRQQAQVSLEGLAAGFYIIELQVGNSRYVTKVVKE